MPAKSKKQYRFFKAIEEGDLKKKGVTKKIAEEFTKGVKPSTLPEKAKPKKGKK